MESTLVEKANSDQPLVYAIVLNWNGYEDSRNCLDSILNITYGNMEICLVDNNSSDGSGKQIEDEFSDVDVLFNNKNLGFSGGMNQGVEFALDSNADYIWILNNDIVIPPETDIVSRLVEPMEESDDVGISTPVGNNLSSASAGFSRSSQWRLIFGRTSL